MQLRMANWLLLAAAGLAWMGCAGAQKGLDKALLKGWVGKKYSEETRKLKHATGAELASEPLTGGYTLHVHAQGYEAHTVSYFGLFGNVKYAYKVSGFKVKDDTIEDWAYALWQPEKKYTHILGFELGYNEKKVFEDIKLQYLGLMRTSAEEPVASWKQ